MAADLDFAATVDVLIDYCAIVVLIGPLDWASFVHGYRAYDAWYLGEANSLPTSGPNRHPLVAACARVA